MDVDAFVVRKSRESEDEQNYKLLCGADEIQQSVSERNTGAVGLGPDAVQLRGKGERKSR
jgi:hypothetical protein